MTYAAGPFYYTDDNWETVDKSRMLYDVSDKYNIIRNFRSLGKDTLIAYGPNWEDGFNHLTLSALRSVDNGRHWTAVRAIDTIIGNVLYISALDRPYSVLSGGNRSVKRSIGISVDSGASWNFIPIIFDSAPPYYASEASHIDVTPSGAAIGIFAVVEAGNTIDPSFIARTSLVSRRVENYERIIYATMLHPNPATTSLSVQSVDYGQPLLMYDILGHEVVHGKLDGSGHAQFDVSALPRGVYSVILNHNGIPLPIGKVVVVGR
jgi:hypothetical protein